MNARTAHADMLRDAKVLDPLRQSTEEESNPPPHVSKKERSSIESGPDDFGRCGTAPAAGDRGLDPPEAGAGASTGEGASGADTAPSGVGILGGAPDAAALEGKAGGDADAGGEGPRIFRDRAPPATG